MTFHRMTETSASPHDLVCRESPLPRLIATIVGFGFVALVLWFPPLRGKWFGWLIAAILALFPLAFFNLFRKTLGPQNWIVRISARGVMVKFRSFANAHLNDQDEVIVSLAPEEVEWVGQRREKLLSPSSDGGVRQESIKYLEIGLRNVDTAELERRLAEERSRRPAPSRVETITRDYPVRLVEGSTLQIRWRGATNAIKPSLKKVLAELSRFAPVREPRTATIDTVTSAAKKADQESQILALAERGDTFGAVKIARKRYGCSLAEAKKLVEELAASPREVPTKVD